MKAPIDRVSDSFAEQFEMEYLLRNVPICEVQPDSGTDIWTAIVQPKNNGWSVIFWGTADWAKSLSARLNTKAATLMMDDTDAGTAYEIYEKGSLIEKAYWTPDYFVSQQRMMYESAVRPYPDLDLLAPDDNDATYDAESGTSHNEQVFHQFIDDIFCEEGIYIPACWADGYGSYGQLAVEGPSMGSIERADLLWIEK